nr:Ig-like domain-containing protein [uncultured Dyadobacter sp.]
MIRYILLTGMLLLLGYAFAQSQTREVFMCRDATLRIRAESAGAVRFDWYHDNVKVTGSGSRELAVSEEGTYKAVGLNADGCASQESVYIVVKHHKPAAVDDIASGKTNADLIIDVLKNDQSVCANLDPTTLTVATQPDVGTVLSANGRLTYTPARDFEGEVAFSYQVKDMTGQLSNAAMVRMEIVKDPLPVRLIVFDVHRNDAYAILDWSTSGEIDSDHFQVERSSDMQAWTAIGEQKAAFSSNARLDYQFVDSLPASGLNYYRLKMVDTDSSFSYSRVRSVHFPELSWAEIFPNPVDDQLYVVIRNPKVKSFRMISNAGTVRLSKLISGSHFTIQMKQYPIGMYYIHFEQEDGAVKIFKLMHN